MLTKRSSKRKMLKALVAIPVALCCMFCFTKSAYSFKKGEENVVVFKGNKFEFDGPVGSTRSVSGKELKGKIDGKEVEEVIFFPTVVKMNGKPIESFWNVTQKPVFLGKDKSMSIYLLNSIRSEMEKLEDGEYYVNVNNSIIDEKGNLAYYEVEGVKAYDIKIVKSVKEAIDSKLRDAIENAPKFKPAELNGKAVVVDFEAIVFGYRVIVKNHNVEIEYRKPQMLKKS